eukprot:s6407_g5.t4
MAGEPRWLLVVPLRWVQHSELGRQQNQQQLLACRSCRMSCRTFKLTRAEVLAWEVQPKLRRIVHEVRAIAASNRHQASGRFSGRGGNLERGVAEVSGGPIQNYVLVFGPIRVFNRANFAKIAGGKVNEDTENGFEIWRRLFNQFSLPSRARATNLLNETIAFRLRSDHLESDLSDFIILKNRHEKTTGVPLDNDLLITLIMQKTTGPLQPHLWLKVKNINTITEALEIVYSYIKSKHLVVPSRNDGPVDMDIGALKGRKGYGKGKGKGKGYKGKGMFKGKGKGKSKGFKGKKGQGMKGKGQGCFICGDPNHWSKECPKGKGRMSALTEEERQQEGNQEEWSQDAEWYGDEWDEYDWSQDWIGSLGDWSGDWSWSEDDWSSSSMTGHGVLRIGGVLSSRV